MSTSSLLPTAEHHDQTLGAWLASSSPRPRISGHHQAQHADAQVPFAFYGRTSTGRFQDPTSSRHWQREDALTTIAGCGRIVIEFFDVGYSRSVAWQHRPQAAALLAAAADPHREFDAVVIGEFERAFTAGHANSIIAHLHAYGVTVWMAEFDGPVDLAAPSHQALLMLLGHQSAREVLRARRRTTAAMSAQARTQGRYLGGRPPYGYRFVDAGPHPNPQHARWGRQLVRLDPDAVTAPHVRWIFAQRLAGLSTAAIARDLNTFGVPTPSAHDPARNPHRAGVTWSLRTVAAILANPRYTGRQVWNRQRIDHHETRPGNKNSRPPGGKPTRAWNPREQWEVSAPGAHPALVSDADFLHAQTITALAMPADGTTDRYQLTGLVICGVCGRRAEGHWAHQRACYRCRHGYTSALGPQPGRPKALYLRQDTVVGLARTRWAHLTGTDCADIDAAELAALLRADGITIVCTPAGVTLDAGPG